MLLIVNTTEYNYLVCLVRAFRDNKWKSIVIDDRRQKFQILAAEYGVSEGLLNFDEVGSDESQYTAWVYNLTKLGEKVLLDVDSPNEYKD